MSRKSGNRFSDKDMRKPNKSRAHPDSTQSGCALLVPIRCLVDGLSAHHGHRGGDVAQSRLLDAERIGAQDRKVSELAGLERALLAFVEGDIGAIDRGPAKG